MYRLYSVQVDGSKVLIAEFASLSECQTQMALDSSLTYSIELQTEIGFQVIQ